YARLSRRHLRFIGSFTRVGQHPINGRDADPQLLNNFHPLQTIGIAPQPRHGCDRLVIGIPAKRAADAALCATPARPQFPLKPISA
ncbi:MAG: hypothetical protein WB902_10770, partial [Acetobacteraceae bacterium]